MIRDTKSKAALPILNLVLQDRLLGKTWQALSGQAWSCLTPTHLEMTAMKRPLIALLLLTQTPAVLALPHSSLPPSMIEISAKFAQAKAQLQTEQDAASLFQGASNGESTSTDGCDLSVGSLELDGQAGQPDEVVIIVTGDVIQANNCR